MRLQRGSALGILAQILWVEPRSEQPLQSICRMEGGWSPRLMAAMVTLASAAPSYILVWESLKLTSHCGLKFAGVIRAGKSLVRLFRWPMVGTQ